MSDDTVEYITESQALLIARETAVATSNEILKGIGIDISTPEAAIAMQVDFSHLRRHRKGSENTVKQIKKSGIAFITVGAITAVWFGVQEIIKAKTGG